MAGSVWQPQTQSDGKRRSEIAETGNDQAKQGTLAPADSIRRLTACW